MSRLRTAIRHSSRRGKKAALMGGVSAMLSGVALFLTWSNALGPVGALAGTFVACAASAGATSYFFYLRQRQSTPSRRQTRRPPAFAEFLMMLIAAKGHDQGLIGDFEEKFRGNIKRFGHRRAVWMYRAEAAMSAGPMTYAALKRIGVVGVIIKVATRILS